MTRCAFVTTLSMLFDGGRTEAIAHRVTIPGQPRCDEAAVCVAGLGSTDSLHDLLGWDFSAPKTLGQYPLLLVVLVLDFGVGECDTFTTENPATPCPVTAPDESCTKV
jgi:hypothetical protein